MKHYLPTKQQNKIWILALLTFIFTHSILVTVQAQTCSNLSGIINTYAPVSNITGNVVSIGATTGAATAFAVGDYAVLIQMTGSSPAITSSNMGKYELRLVTAVSGSNITLSSISNTYSYATEKVQLVRTPHCPTATVTSSVTAKIWDGTTGGIIALHGGTLTLNASIDATGTGFSQTNSPYSSVSTSLSTGLGSTSGRGNNGGSAASAGGIGGGGIGGGGGDGGGLGGDGAGVGGSGGGGNNSGGSIASSGSGVGGGEGGSYDTAGLITGTGGGGGGGGIIGGGGGGGGGNFITPTPFPLGGGGGGGVGGGGGGGGSSLGTTGGGGGGGGGTLGVGNGADALFHDSAGGAGGGSYGGGGGAAGVFSGGDDAVGGGGGGSWTGGGCGGLPGGATTYANAIGGTGNTAVSTVIPNTAHYLNTTQPRLMMGGGGGDATCQLGGFGGGIVIMEFNNIIGNNQSIRSDGQSLGLAPYCTAVTGNNSGAGGGGGGGGGQVSLRVNTFSNSAISVAGGKGGDGNNDMTYHGGAAGAGGGGGGVWLYSATTQTNTGGSTVAITGINTFGAAGGVNGASTNNPKNSRTTGTGACGGNGLIVASNDTPSWPQLACTALSALTATATPSSLATGSSSTLNVTGTGITAGTTTYSWARSGGGFTATTQNPSTGTISTTGAYSYTVTATNANGTGTCTATATTSLTVSTTATVCTTPTITSITKQPSGIVIGGEVVNLTANATGVTGTTTYQWSASSGSFSSTAALPANVNITYTAANVSGTVTLSLTVANSTCTTTATTTLLVATCYKIIDNGTDCAGTSTSANGAGISYNATTFNGHALFTQNVKLYEDFIAGTARIVGTLSANQDGTGEQVTIDLRYTGYTTTSPNPGSEQANICTGNIPPTTGWRWYVACTGTLVSSATGTYDVTRYGPALQLGIDAGERFRGNGVSGWHTLTGASGQTGQISTGNFDFWSSLTTVEVCGPCTTLSNLTATATPSSLATGSSSTLNVTGTGITAGVTTFAWAGTGGFTATTQNPSTGALATAGGYSYTVTVTNTNGTGTCTATATTSLTVSTAAVACTNTVTTICNTQTITLTAEAGLVNVQWYKDGTAAANAIAGANGLTYTTGVAGIYYYKAQDNTGCELNLCCGVQIIVNTCATPCTALSALSATATPSSLATGSSSTLNVTGTGITVGSGTPPATTFSWAGTGGFTATTQNPSTGALATAGGYSYTVTATNANGTGICTATATTSLTVSTAVGPCTALSALTATATPSSLATGSSSTLNVTGTGITAGTTTFAWAGTGGFTATTQNPSTGALATAGGYSYTVTATNANGTGTCTATATTTLTVLCPTITPVVNANSVCQGQTINFSAAGGNTYAWAGPNGFNSTLQNPVIPNAILANAGTYQLTIIGAGGCSVSTTIAVVVTPMPTATITPEQVTCNGNSSNNDAKIRITNPNNVSKVGYSTGINYAGPAFPAANNTPANGDILTNIPNPSTATNYTVRIFNNANCYTDYTVILQPKICVCPDAKCLDINVVRIR